MEGCGILIFATMCITFDNDSNSYSIVQFDKEGSIFTDYDNYAFLNSCAYHKIFGHRMHSSFFSLATDISGYLKLKRGNRKIYLRYHSWNSVKGNEVMISYRNRCLLGCGESSIMKNNPIAEIKASNWFCYYLFNNDAGIRMPFWIAIAGILLSIIFFIIQTVY